MIALFLKVTFLTAQYELFNTLQLNTMSINNPLHMVMAGPFVPLYFITILNYPVSQC